MSVFENAKWIMAANAPEQPVDSYYDYWTVFSVSGDIPVTLYISAHSHYAVYVNGEFVDCGQLPDTENRQIYDTLDISAFVQPGQNTLFITQQVIGVPFPTCSMQIPGVIFAVYADGKAICVSDESCLSGANRRYLPKGEKITVQLGFNFEYDANGPQTEFVPCVAAAKEKNLIPRPTKKMVVGQPQKAKLKAQGVFLENDSSLPKSQRMHSAYLSAMTKKQLDWQKGAFSVPNDRRADGVYLLYDIGEETAGYLQFSLEVPQATEILIGWGEHLEDLRVRTACGYRHFCCRYIAKPGLNTFFHPFRRIGLRYLQLHIYSKTGTVTEVAIRPTRYPASMKPAPVKSAFHKRIWDVAANTLHLCMQDHFCDCIWREQTMYPYDGRMQMLSCYYGFEAPEFVREAIRICAETLRPDGLLQICAPGKDDVCIPSYSAVFIRSVLEYTQFTGDISLAKEVFPVMQTIAQGFAARIALNGLIALYQGQEYWHFYEWNPGMNGKPIGGKRVPITEEVYEVPMNAFVADGFECFGKLCKLLQPDTADQWLDLAQSMKAATHEYFFTDNGYVTRLADGKPCHELTQGLMLYIGAVPEQHKDMIEELIRSGTLIKSTIGLSIFTYEGLLRNGANRDYVLNDIEKRWGMMLEKGCDTFWETENGCADFGGAGALCQGWSAAPLYLFGHYRLHE